jgi:hypothetical protein
MTIPFISSAPHHESRRCIPGYVLEMIGFLQIGKVTRKLNYWKRSVSKSQLIPLKHAGLRIFQYGGDKKPVAVEGYRFLSTIAPSTAHPVEDSMLHTVVRITSLTESINILKRCVGNGNVDELLGELTAQTVVSGCGLKEPVDFTKTSFLLKLVTTASKICISANEDHLIFDIISSMQSFVRHRSEQSEPAGFNESRDINFMRSALLVVIQDNLTLKRLTSDGSDSNKPKVLDRSDAAVRQIIRAHRQLLAVGGSVSAELYNQLIIQLAQSGALSHIIKLLPLFPPTDVALVYAAEPLIMSGQGRFLLKPLKRYMQRIREPLLSQFSQTSDAFKIRDAQSGTTGRILHHVIRHADSDARIISSITRICRAVHGAICRRLMSNTRLWEAEAEALSAVNTALFQFIDNRIETTLDPGSKVMIGVKFQWLRLNEHETRGILRTTLDLLESVALVEDGQDWTAFEETGEQDDDLEDSEEDDDDDDSSDESEATDDSDDDEGDSDTDDEDFQADSSDDVKQEGDDEYEGVYDEDGRPAFRTVVNPASGQAVVLMNSSFVEDLQDAIPFERTGFTYVVEDRTFPLLTRGGLSSKHPAINDITACLACNNQPPVLLFNSRLFPSTYQRHMKELADGISSCRSIWSGSYSRGRPILDDPILYRSRRASLSQGRKVGRRRSRAPYISVESDASAVHGSGLALSGGSTNSLPSTEDETKDDVVTSLAARLTNGTFSVADMANVIRGNIVTAKYDIKRMDDKEVVDERKSPSACEFIDEDQFGGSDEGVTDHAGVQNPSFVDYEKLTMSNDAQFYSTMYGLGSTVSEKDAPLCKDVTDLTRAILWYDCRPPPRGSVAPNVSDDSTNKMELPSRKLSYVERRKYRRDQIFVKSPVSVSVGGPSENHKPRHARRKRRPDPGVGSWERVKVSSAVFFNMDPGNLIPDGDDDNFGEA